jgi:hypothetical protein
MREGDCRVATGGTTLQASLSERHVTLIVRLPDRPGALGSVASRIGAVGADITHIGIRRVDKTKGRGSETARPVPGAPLSVLDEFHLDLPITQCDPLALLQRELAEVDGAEIVEMRPIHRCPACR